MTQALTPARRGPAAAVAVLAVVLGCGGLAAASAPDVALINESPSLPRGLYLRAVAARPVRGATVALQQPASARAYLSGLGMPAEVRLLKRVAAGPGDRVCRSGTRVEAADQVVVARRRDRRGVRLPEWRGCRRLGADEVFLLGDTATSFDSRYFGPVRVADLDGVFVETITW